MLKVRSVFASVGATTIEQTLLEITTPEGHQYNYKEFGVGLTDDCIIYIYLEDELLVQYSRDGDDDVRRTVVNWDTTGGNLIKVTATNNSGGALDCGITLDYDDVT